jgi:hypothetical protein
LLKDAPESTDNQEQQEQEQPEPAEEDEKNGKKQQPQKKKRAQKQSLTPFFSTNSPPQEVRMLLLQGQILGVASLL